MAIKRRRFTKRRGRLSIKNRKYRKGGRGVKSGFTQSSGSYGRFRSAGGRIPGGISKEEKFFEQGIQVNCEGGTGIVEPAFAPGTGTTHGSMVSGIVQGTAAYNRDGRKIFVTRINIKLNISIMSTQLATNPTAAVRWLFVKDTQCNGLTATTAQVMNQPAGGDNSTLNYVPQNAMYYGYNKYNSDRFIILHDEILAAPVISTAAVNGYTGPRIVDKTFRVNTGVIYSDAAAGSTSVANVKSNNFFMIFMTDVQPTTNPLYYAVISGAFEIRFIDD